LDPAEPSAVKVSGYTEPNLKGPWTPKLTYIFYPFC